MTPHHPDVTTLLQQWSDGDQEALDKLMPLVYDELRSIASAYLQRERQAHTLQTTALVNEAFLRLIDQRRVHWRNRTHFYGIAAQLMRRVLIDHARAHQTNKRGKGQVTLLLDEAFNVSTERDAELIALDDALKSLAEIDPRKAQIVEMRFFGGMTAEEIAEALGISTETVKRQWRLAKAWLYRELNKENDHDS